MSEETLYDLIIIGGGPAGLSAGVYGGRAKLKNINYRKRFSGRSCIYNKRNCKLSWL